MTNLFERALDGGKRALGETVNAGAHLVGDGLDLVGLDSAAHAVDRWGDNVADSLGALVGELNLGQTDDPKELVHGDVGAVTTAARHLHKFQAAFDETGSGLTRLDAEHWKGAAGDAFRARFSPQPALWVLAAEACGSAAEALDTYARTVEWAQGRARQAIDAYEAARKASERARDAYNDQVDRYNDAVKQYNSAAAAGGTDLTRPTDPGTFHDPGQDGLKQAQDLLREARRQRDAAALAAADAVSAATGSAPREPSFLQQVAAAQTDLVQGAAVGSLHLLGGVAKGGADAVKFVRSLNPQDPYNLTHPAQYQEHVLSTSLGLLRTANHPTELVKSLAGSGWRSDPFEATGRVIFDVASGAATGGGSTAGIAAKRAAANALKNSAERTALRGADDLAERAATNAARHTDVSVPAQAAPPTRLEGFPEAAYQHSPPARPDGFPEAAHHRSPPARVEGFPDAAYQHAPEPAPAHVPEPSAPEPPHVPEPEASAHVPEPEAPAHVPEPEAPSHAPEPEAPVHEPEVQAAESAKPVENEFDRALRTQQEQAAIRDAVQAQARTAKLYDDDAAQSYAQQTWNRTADGLREPEKVAFDSYSRGQGNRGTGPTYDEVNGALRTADGRIDGVTDAGVRRSVELMDQALRRQPVPQDIIVTRGTDIEHLVGAGGDPHSLKGLTFTERGYLSTGFGDLPAMWQGKQAVMHIKVPAGTPAMWMEKPGAVASTERELLLGRDLKWRATEVLDDGNRVHIFAEILP
ncbi:putative T7SS-secreted protein [Kitasatospora sp. NPDC051853]|uniref:putative T7SS-secreted protein n=1 Tax=Kitasatospora sp. NPDC051853 TaxID=3364058 RepID=UPI0037AD2869